MGDLDERVILKLDHEVEGELVVLRKSDIIQVRIRWPFDLIEDDFVEIAESFSAQEWQQAIDAAQASNRDSLALQSENGAFLRIHETSSVAHIEVGSRRGPLFRSMQLAIPGWHGLATLIDD